MSSINGQNIVDRSSVNFDDAIIVMRPSKGHYFLILVITVVVTAYAMFADVIPVLITLDYSSVFSGSENRIGKQIFHFYLGLFLCAYIPAWAPIFRIGNAYFFNDKLIITPFFSKKIKSYYYENMQVTQDRMLRLKIDELKVGSDYNIFKKIKNRYFDGVVFGLTKKTINNYEIVEDVLSLLKNNSAKYLEK
ncbi:hypothetical protein [Desulfuromonas sp. AOP6]|uniref:hypothetical protein n=1 Tax=Desulfuromonas sp. AOP6 TaxID=1566351 RepID=UPI00126D8A40|nr:hypothetical protein [Desulfuromonas sp. AOP6]BCA78848.1 hypothetical protein AOP6_0635 [Desulfuromonas sp. AOP6]